MLFFKDFLRSCIDREFNNYLVDLPKKLIDFEQNLLLSKDKKLLNLVNAFADFKTTAKFSANQSVNFDSSLSNVEIINQFKPWKKGPWCVNNIYIDSEWRCDFKLDRLMPHLNLKGSFLDIGSNNGYFMFQLISKGAQMAIGVDKALVPFMQFNALKNLTNATNIHLLPFLFEEIPNEKFDTILSLGVLYHLKDPYNHLNKIKHNMHLKSDFFLETLILPDDYHDNYLVCDTYAKMKNIFYITKLDVIYKQLKRLNFKNINIIDINSTTTDEQRVTKYSANESLADFLKPCKKLTVENYPAPLRVIIKAQI